MKRGQLLNLVLLAFTIISITTVIAQYESPTGLDDDIKLYCNRETAYSTGVSDARKGLARKEDYAQICSVSREYFNEAYNTGYNYGLTNQSGLIVNEPAPNHPEIQNQLPSSYVQPYTRPVAVTTNPNVLPVVPQANSSAVANPASGQYGTATRNAQIGSTSSDNRASRTPQYPGEVAVPSGDFAKPEPGHGLKTLIEVAPSAQPKCIESVSGEACGFNCINSLNNVRCAATPDQVCRANELGQIACGYHCVATVKTVRCAMVPTDQCIADNNGNVFCGVNCRVEGDAQGRCDIERYAP